MRKNFLIAVALIALIASFRSPIVSYFHLWSFDYHRGWNVMYQDVGPLKEAITSAQYAGWNNVPLSIFEQYAPKGPNIVEVRFNRGAVFPTGQILLEYTVGEYESNISSGDISSGTLIGYRDIVYMNQLSDGQYKYIRKFRRFIP